MNDRIFRSDKEYLRVNRINPLPPSAKDIDLIIDRLNFEEISCAERKKQFEDWAQDRRLPGGFLEQEFEKRYVFMSAQSLVPLFKSLGYDIRHILDANMISVPNLVYERIAECAGIDKPPLAGGASLDGRDGVILPYDWLVAAGLTPQVISDVRAVPRSGYISR